MVAPGQSNDFMKIRHCSVYLSAWRIALKSREGACLYACRCSDDEFSSAEFDSLPRNAATFDAVFVAASLAWLAIYSKRSKPG